ncbi:MAG: hypothetical protein IJF87_02590 [Erysipelotrichaceae bacterium]|nr:hypothetical protein [Erysipelotrichaceae bacterium]
MNRYQESDSTSYSLGMSLTIELLKQHPEKVREILLSQKAVKNSQLDLLLDLCKKNRIVPKYDDQLIEKLSVKENCYCIGVFSKYSEEVKQGNHIVLYGFSDFGELGTVLRTSVSFDFKDIILINSDLDYFDPRCIRASMGSFFHCRISSYRDLDAYLKEHPARNLYPFVSDGDKELSDLVLNEPYSIMISQDFKGLDQMKDGGYYLDHKKQKEISLSIRSSIILAHAYYLNLKR